MRWIKEIPKNYTSGMHNFITNANTHINTQDSICSMLEAYLNISICFS